MWLFPNFHLWIFKNFVLSISLVYIVFLLFISCLLIYMLNYLLFLSMVHEYAYFYEFIWKPVYCILTVLIVVTGMVQLSATKFKYLVTCSCQWIVSGVTVYFSSAISDLMLMQQNKFYWISDRFEVAELNYTVTVSECYTFYSLPLTNQLLLFNSIL